MKKNVAEFFCVALLWTGAAGVVASLYIGHTHGAQIQSLCAFASVIAMGCIAKMLVDHADKTVNDGALV